MRQLTITFFLMFLLLHNLKSNAQNVYYDAVKLRAFTNEDGDLKSVVDSVYFILDNYFEPKKKNTIHELDSILRLEENPFLIISGSARSQEEDNIVGNAANGFAKNLSSLNVTNLADGIARFLIKRGKEELNVAFFNRMNKFLNEHEECKTLFPSTTDFLKNIDLARYAEFLQSLREAFHKDLSNLVTGLNQLIDLPKYTELLKNFPEIRLALRSLRIVNELSQSGKAILPDSIIHQLANLNEWKEIDLNLANSWKALDIISQSVRYIPQPQDGSDTTMCWIKLSDMNELIQDTIKLKIFLGLLYQKMDGVEFKGKDGVKSIQAFMFENRFSILTVASLVDNFITLANDVDRSIQDIRQKKDIGFSKDDYYTYISKAINITEYGFKVANTINPGIADNRYISIAKNGNNLYKNIYTKNYNNAVMDVYNILNQIFGDKSSLVIEKTQNSKDAKLNNSLTTSVNSVKFPSPKIIEGILKYGNFMASVIKSESAEDVESALDAAALPSGSYSIKQKSAWNLSVNGYIGYAWDFYKFPFKDQYARGIYAPVGVAISRGSRKPHGITFSGFLSLIDVGGIASYRLQNGNDEALKQEVRLESIFSPSGQLFVEYRGLPFAIGGGWRRTSRLFYSGNTSFTAVPPKNVFNFSVLIDVSLFTIKNWPF
ncbi:MAG: hypothetical protein ABI760_11115 [Ferruginibacter sp.]